MYCSSCGMQLPNGSKFCNGCGVPFGGAVQPAAPLTVANPYRGKKEQIAGGVIVALALILFLVALSADSAVTAGFGALLFCVGVVIMLVGKFSHWYHAE